MWARVHADRHRVPEAVRCGRAAEAPPGRPPSAQPSPVNTREATRVSMPLLGPCRFHNRQHAHSVHHPGGFSEQDMRQLMLGAPPPPAAPCSTCPRFWLCSAIGTPPAGAGNQMCPASTGRHQRYDAGWSSPADPAVSPAPQAPGLRTPRPESLPLFRGRRRRSLTSSSACTCSWPQPGGRREGRTDACLGAWAGHAWSSSGLSPPRLGCCSCSFQSEHAGTRSVRCRSRGLGNQVARLRLPLFAHANCRMQLRRLCCRWPRLCAPARCCCLRLCHSLACTKQLCSDGT